jgi:hypothetical protein
MKRFRSNNRKRRGQRSKQPQSNPQGRGNDIIPHGMPFHTTMTAWLKYDDTSIVRTNVGATFVGWRYRMNSAFDPDPLLGTGALPGFNEYASFYVAYRVVDFAWSITLTNDELFPMTTYAVPLNQDPGPNPSNGLTLAANYKGSVRGLSAIGGPNARFSGRVNLANMFGIAGYNYDDDFNAGVAANPSVPLFFLVGAQTPAPLTVSGLVITVRLSFRVIFNRRKNLAA